MKARQVIGGSSYTPDVLKVLFEAFDDAWADIGPEISARPSAIEAARLSLAEIVLSLAAGGPIERVSLKTAAIDAFRDKHGRH